MHTYFYTNKLPKSMPKREKEALVSTLEEVVRAAKMESADFGNGASPEENPTQFIKETVDLHHHTWIVSPLEALIDRYKAEL